MHSNYKIRNLNALCFDKVNEMENDVNFAVYNRHCVVYATNTEIFRWTEKETKKIFSGKEKITHMECTDDLVCLRLHTGDIKVISTDRLGLVHIENFEEMVIKMVIHENKIKIATENKIHVYDIKTDTFTDEIEGFKNVLDCQVFKNEFYVLDGRKIIKMGEGKAVNELKCVFTFENDVSGFKMAEKHNKVLCLAYNRTELFLHCENKTFSKIAHYKNIKDVMVFDGFIYTVSDDMHFKSFDFTLTQRSNVNVRENCRKIALFKEVVLVVCKNSILSKKKRKMEIKLNKEFVFKKKNEFDEDIEADEIGF